jgi:phosphoglycolate phosphatase-like HAD superfamily hydrolase
VICNILWDVDGTLIDTRPGIIYALSRSLTEMGTTVAMNEIDGLMRQPLRHCLETLSGRFGLDPRVLHERFWKTYQNIPLERQAPFADVLKVCDFIQRRGRNVIITHRTVDSTWNILEVHGLAEYFAGIVSVEQGYAKKPNAEMFNVALSRYRLCRDDTLAIGDLEGDIVAARATGLQTCLFGQTTLLEPADYHISSYAELLEILNKLSITNRGVRRTWPGRNTS